MLSFSVVSERRKRNFELELKVNSFEPLFRTLSTLKVYSSVFKFLIRTMLMAELCAALKFVPSFRDKAGLFIKQFWESNWVT